MLCVENQTIALGTDRRSACPGLFRMTQALDGGICRVKLSLGQLTSVQAHVIADIAQEFGNGIIELTIRSNMQLRGIAPQNHQQVIDALINAGLGPLVPEGDDVRNVMVSPTAGVDQQLIFDTRPLATQLLETLQRNPAYHALSPKFSVLIDGGEACAMTSHPSDIWLAAMENTNHYAFGLGSCPDDKVALGAINTDQAHAFMTSIIDLFLDLSSQHNGVSRMKHLFTHISPEDFLNQLGCPVQAIDQWQRATPTPLANFGLHQQRQPNLVYAGSAPQLGRLTPGYLHTLAEIADHANGGKIHLTPWQSLILPNIQHADGEDILDRIKAIGMVVTGHEAIAGIRACAGSAGCASALGDTQNDGTKLSQLLTENATKAVHITGCAKSCASISTAPATLLAREPGRYDLFLADSAGPSRFGRLLASDITIEDAAQLLKISHRL